MDLKEKFLNQDELASLLNVNRTVLLRDIAKQPHFPKRISVTSKKFLWKKEEIENWLNQKQANA